MPEIDWLSEGNIGGPLPQIPSLAVWEDPPEEPEEFPVRIGDAPWIVRAKRDDRPRIAYCEAELKRLGNLPENWDSYGALRVSQSSLKNAFETYLTLTQYRGHEQWPHFASTPDGGIGLMWHHNDKGLEVEIDGQLVTRCYFYDDANDQESPADMTPSLPRINTYLDEVFG